MHNQLFKAWVVEETEDGFLGTVKDRSINDLPDNELLVRVKYSSLNYKDALSATGNRGVTRAYPHTPGIDAAGVVEHDSSGRFSKGDEVIVTSYDLGMNTDGGYGQYIRVPSTWAVKKPEGISLRESMIIGTAGLTAGMSVYELIQQVSTDGGVILVTGSTGGVGSIAVAILSQLGYSVTALTGKPGANAFLQSLGAKDTIDRKTFLENTDRPMLKSQWGGVVDTVGGNILEAAIKATHPLGAVTCCGNVASADLSLTVFPFILRGIRLIGIDSQNCPLERRQKIWNLLASDWKVEQLDSLGSEIRMDQLDENISKILNGQQQGRVVINMQ